jgi:membrane-anchored protein YejM (alkaline phosphatase superfamily)
MTEIINFLLLTYDSCRYDVLASAKTPVLDSFSPIHCAEAPANFTFASHQAFFVGFLPNIKEYIPYYNRFRKQLLGLVGVGEGQIHKTALKKSLSSWNFIQGMTNEGYQTVGAGAMNWFRQESLTAGFEKFLFTGRDADRQIDFLLENIDISRPFFGFVNFGETHAPYTYRGKTEPCKDDVRARRMSWPPIEHGLIGAETDGFRCQVAAAEFLDTCLPRLFETLPGNTIVVLTSDHGDCFGEARSQPSYGV